MGGAKISLLLLGACAAVLAEGPAPAAAQSSAQAVLPSRLQPIFAPETATVFVDANYYGQRDRRAVYRRNDDVVQVQGGAVVRVAPEASVIVGANYNHIDGRKLFPTTGSYRQEGGSAFLGAALYLARNYTLSVVGGGVKDTIDENGLGQLGRASDHRLLRGGFFSTSLDANYLYSGGRAALFARYLYYEGTEEGSFQSDGAFRPQFRDSLGRVTVGGELYGRVQAGDAAIEPMVRAALLYDTKRQAFYTTRAAVELAAGANLPMHGTTVALRAFGEFGRREYRTYGVRISFYRNL